MWFNLGYFKGKYLPWKPKYEKIKIRLINLMKIEGATFDPRRFPGNHSNNKVLNLASRLSASATPAVNNRRRVVLFAARTWEVVTRPSANWKHHGCIFNIEWCSGFTRWNGGWRVLVAVNEDVRGEGVGEGASRRQMERAGNPSSENINIFSFIRYFMDHKQW